MYVVVLSDELVVPAFPNSHQVTNVILEQAEATMLLYIECMISLLDPVWVFYHYRISIYSRSFPSQQYPSRGEVAALIVDMIVIYSHKWHHC